VLIPATISILVLTALVTLAAFRRRKLQDRLIFSPYDILRHKQIYRMLTSGLIHADWTHFLFNAFSFYCFGQNLEIFYGAKTLLLIYLSSILGGSLLSLMIHRHEDYRALGASGGVCGVIFASIFLLPGGAVTIYLIPFGIPAYVYAIGFLVASFVAHRRKLGNIGHDAHLGGAIVGLLVATVMYPRLVLAAPWMFLAVIGLSAAILVALIIVPMHIADLRWNAPYRSPGNERSREYDENRERNRKMAEIDRLLDKVSKAGVGKLSASERKKLSGLSKEIYGGRPDQS
jgi:membrane associated rhomboid family serine protease